MWVRGERRTLVNLDYVTQIEPRIMDAPMSLDRDPEWEIIAYRRPPIQDAILLSLLDRETAVQTVDRLTEFIRSGADLVDVADVADQIRMELDKARHAPPATVS